MKESDRSLVYRGRSYAREEYQDECRRVREAGGGGGGGEFVDSCHNRGVSCDLRKKSVCSTTIPCGRSRHTHNTIARRHDRISIRKPVDGSTVFLDGQIFSPRSRQTAASNLCLPKNDDVVEATRHVILWGAHLSN